jgi:hypothetical protein
MKCINNETLNNSLRLCLFTVSSRVLRLAELSGISSWTGRTEKSKETTSAMVNVTTTTTSSSLDGKESPLIDQSSDIHLHQRHDDLTFSSPDLINELSEEELFKSKL